MSSHSGEEVEVEEVSSGYPILPKEVLSEVGTVKLFNKWYVQIRDIMAGNIWQTGIIGENHKEERARADLCEIQELRGCRDP